MAEQKKRTTELDVDFSVTEEEVEPVEKPKEIIEEIVEEKSEGLDPKKKLIIIIGSVVISLILAAVVYFVFIKEEAPAIEEVSEKVEKEEEEEEEEDIPVREEYVPAITYIVAPFLIPITDQEGNAMFLQVSLELVLSNEYVIKDLDKNITALRQNLLYVFKTKSVKSFQNLEKKAVLKQEIITAANRVLQRGTIYEVFFIGFSVH